MADKNFKLAIIGTRGLPANYGGFETFAAEISEELTGRGHAVTVYGRQTIQQFVKNLREGKSSVKQLGAVRTIATPTVYQKYLETPLSSLTAYIHALFGGYDAVLICNAANSPCSIILRIGSVKILTNVDGIERKRSKWNAAGRLWYRLGEYCAAKFSDLVVTDADVISEYYQEKFSVNSEMIRYGAKTGAGQDHSDVLEQFDLRPGEYLLYVSRLEPENNAAVVIEAYAALTDPKYPLVIVGDAPYATTYINGLHTMAEQSVNQIIFTGYQFGADYQSLRNNCYLYVQATEVGGTHPALVEAMRCGNAVIANDVPEHREVLQEYGLYYEFNDAEKLGLQMQKLLDNQSQAEQLGRLAADYAGEHYIWSRIADQYESAIMKVLKSTD